MAKNSGSIALRSLMRFPSRSKSRRLQRSDSVHSDEDPLMDEEQGVSWSLVYKVNGEGIDVGTTKLTMLHFVGIVLSTNANNTWKSWTSLQTLLLALAVS